MKKFILLVALSSTFIMCKKGETAQSQMEDTLHTADSAASAANEAVRSINHTADRMMDSATVKIKDFEDTQGEIQQKIKSTAKMVDSLSDKIASTKLESKIEKNDSTEKKIEKVIVNVPAPKVIKETKIIYKNQPKNDSYELNAPKDKMVKTGLLSVKADHAETVKELVKEETVKNNGYVKSEELSYISVEPVRHESSYSETNQKVYYMDIKVPIQNFDDLMNDLSSIGDVDNKNIQVSGNNYTDNTLCSILVTLTDKSDLEKEPKTFGGKSLAAISSGWGVITSIFLFILPLWPLFAIGGIAYYFYKKKNKNTTDNTPQS
ncbi:hypothetical protein B0A69_07560 [Chryseobacterium shigense]|uniref:DUF4349 domain-containing protein n=1 Tax=Chryseobacterium shigense TaxID=297244 RepID=A0A1N7I6E5_9FLAO|nr:DUF4349 domain-containing protein [Chryseobacterium shigense]PQA95289.1 hypothetical protein B0A69_07560 [Chryseobacterium shigense]SIS32560.1 protein of unknown function [Chryseobacterium shigense]